MNDERISQSQPNCHMMDNFIRCDLSYNHQEQRKLRKNLYSMMDSLLMNDDDSDSSEDMSTTMQQPQQQSSPSKFDHVHNKKYLYSEAALNTPTLSTNNETMFPKTPDRSNSNSSYSYIQPTPSPATYERRKSDNTTFSTQKLSSTMSTPRRYSSAECGISRHTLKATISNITPPCTPIQSTRTPKLPKISPLIDSFRAKFTPKTPIIPNLSTSTSSISSFRYRKNSSSSTTEKLFDSSHTDTSSIKTPSLWNKKHEIIILRDVHEVIPEFQSFHVNLGKHFHRRNVKYMSTYEHMIEESHNNSDTVKRQKSPIDLLIEKSLTEDAAMESNTGCDEDTIVTNAEDSGPLLRFASRIQEQWKQNFDTFSLSPSLRNTENMLGCPSILSQSDSFDDANEINSIYCVGSSEDILSNVSVSIEEEEQLTPFELMARETISPKQKPPSQISKPATYRGCLAGPSLDEIDPTIGHMISRRVYSAGAREKVVAMIQEIKSIDYVDDSDSSVSSVERFETALMSTEEGTREVILLCDKSKDSPSIIFGTNDGVHEMTDSQRGKKHLREFESRSREFGLLSSRVRARTLSYSPEVDNIPLTREATSIIASPLMGTRLFSDDNMSLKYNTTVRRPIETEEKHEASELRNTSPSPKNIESAFNTSISGSSEYFKAQGHDSILLPSLSNLGIDSLKHPNANAEIKSSELTTQSSQQSVDSGAHFDKEQKSFSLEPKLIPHPSYRSLEGLFDDSMTISLQSEDMISVSTAGSVIISSCHDNILDDKENSSPIYLSCLDNTDDESNNDIERYHISPLDFLLEQNNDGMNSVQSLEEKESYELNETKEFLYSLMATPTRSKRCNGKNEESTIGVPKEEESVSNEKSSVQLSHALSSLEQFDTDMSSHILSYLDIHSISKVSLTSRQMNNACDVDQLWKFMFQNRWSAWSNCMFGNGKESKLFIQSKIAARSEEISLNDKMNKKSVRSFWKRCYMKYSNDCEAFWKNEINTFSSHLPSSLLPFPSTPTTTGTADQREDLYPSDRYAIPSPPSDSPGSYGDMRQIVVSPLPEISHIDIENTNRSDWLNADSVIQNLPLLQESYGEDQQVFKDIEIPVRKKRSNSILDSPCSDSSLAVRAREIPLISAPSTTCDDDDESLYLTHTDKSQHINSRMIMRTRSNDERGQYRQTQQSGYGGQRDFKTQLRAAYSTDDAMAMRLPQKSIDDDVEFVTNFLYSHRVGNSSPKDMSFGMRENESIENSSTIRLNNINTSDSTNIPYSYFACNEYCSDKTKCEIPYQEVEGSCNETFKKNFCRTSDRTSKKSDNYLSINGDFPNQAKASCWLEDVFSWMFECEDRDEKLKQQKQRANFSAPKLNKKSFARSATPASMDDGMFRNGSRHSRGSIGSNFDLKRSISKTCSRKYS